MYSYLRIRSNTLQYVGYVFIRKYAHACFKINLLFSHMSLQTFRNNIYRHCYDTVQMIINNLVVKSKKLAFTSRYIKPSRLAVMSFCQNTIWKSIKKQQALVRERALSLYMGGTKNCPFSDTAQKSVVVILDW